MSDDESCQGKADACSNCSTMCELSLSDPASSARDIGTESTEHSSRSVPEEIFTRNISVVTPVKVAEVNRWVWVCNRIVHGQKKVELQFQTPSGHYYNLLLWTKETLPVAGCPGWREFLFAVRDEGIGSERSSTRSSQLALPVGYTHMHVLPTLARNIESHGVTTRHQHVSIAVARPNLQRPRGRTGWGHRPSRRMALFPTSF